MAEKQLTEEQKKLIAQASRYVETADRIGMEEGASREIDLTGHIVETYCSVCGDDKVHAHPRYQHAARCITCIQEGRKSEGPVFPDSEPTISYEALRAPYVPPVKEAEGLPPHPAPQVTSLQPVPEGVEPPAVVRVLKAKAESAGWSVNLTYARGNGVHGSTGRPTKLVESWALRCWRGTERAVAVYAGGSWSDMWGLAHMFHARTLDQMERYLAGVDESWMRRTRAENTAFEAHKPCTSGEIHDEHPWWAKSGEGRYCNGRTEKREKKTKEAGG